MSSESTLLSRTQHQQYQPGHVIHEQPLREAPAGLDADTLAIWTAIDSLDNVFGPDYVDGLLSESLYMLSSSSAENAHTVAFTPFGDLSKVEVPRCWKGLSNSPHYRTLLREILLWGGSGLYPLSFETGPLLPCCVTNEDGEHMNESNPEKEDQESGIAALRLAVARAARERSPEAFRMALEKIGMQGIPRLLGLRTTAGSVTNSIPVNRETLVVAARARIIGAANGNNNGGSGGRKQGKGRGSNNGSKKKKNHTNPNNNSNSSRVLSISARALTKHCGRQASGWEHSYWGAEETIMNGSDEERNAAAEIVIEKILNNAVWMNVHHAPGGTRVLELRAASGHGARWHAADAAFRGFLEPHSRELATKKKEERRSRAENINNANTAEVEKEKEQGGESNKENNNNISQVNEKEDDEEKEKKNNNNNKALNKNSDSTQFKEGLKKQQKSEVTIEMAGLNKENKKQNHGETIIIKADNAWIKNDTDLETPVGNKS